MAEISTMHVPVRLDVEVDFGQVFAIRAGYDEVMYFSKIESAMVYVQGLLLCKKTQGKHTQMEAWRVDKVEYEWDMLPTKEKLQYPSMDYFRHGIKKQDWHLLIEEDYAKEKVLHEKSWYPLEAYLAEKDLEDRYMKVPDLMLKDYSNDCAVKLDGGLEFGKSTDKGEV